jgi:hypothetical protein
LSSWWSTADFAAFSRTDKQLIDYLTGGIPLLLGPFSGHPGESLAALEPKIWTLEALTSVVEATYDFGVNKKRDELFKS